MIACNLKKATNKMPNYTYIDYGHK